MATVGHSISFLFFFFFTIGSFKVNDLSDVNCFLAKAIYFREKTKKNIDFPGRRLKMALFKCKLSVSELKTELSSLAKLFTKISNSMSNSLNQTLFNKYSDILQRLQICQVGEYPYVKIHNVVGTK